MPQKPKNEVPFKHALRERERERERERREREER